ncbi:glyceraldehyde-3-phosphate dehydrogenase (NAD+) [Scopulibacillus darangshiensis]|uniref:Glyceraldehyde-3-phosphate dehydrogenase n=1 Tax=Scopulibacillus darangshiensis TaxID=442528 RepID=A0A4R2PAT4_9BACL|nr:glyceraldehyde-3-phosphate dehydrogenase [Scopulibacillus darangshiensis]TCP32102.1 glyceraldehyde-3-phosphate dehydrogenase (NAD+) [Scopulibacillus darangshiensis]
MSVNVAINGFGRIGRMVFRKAVNDSQLNIVAINASYPAETLAHLIKYDSVHGRFQGDVDVVDDNTLKVSNRIIQIVNERDPKQCPWKELDIELVIEATGKFKSRETAGYHIEAGAKKVVITAPGKDEDITIVMGVNDDQYNADQHHVVSNASCTTNCLAPVAKVLDEAFGIASGMMTTIHSYTNDQKNIDNPHKDLRRARACAESIIPTSTGAAKAIAKVLPQLTGKLNGMALRVPTPNVSLVDLVVELKKDVTVDDINHALQSAAEAPANHGILAYTDEPLVSIDFNTDEHSAIVDGLSTMVMDGNKVKVLAWYDNEWGYSCRVVDLAKLIAAGIANKKNVKVS